MTTADQVHRLAEIGQEIRKLNRQTHALMVEQCAIQTQLLRDHGAAGGVPGPITAFAVAPKDDN